MTTEASNIPDGFARHFRQSPLTEPWEPLYSKVENDFVVLAIRASGQHCNARGFVHGGLISALADNALGLSCARQHESLDGLVTVNLNVEFLRTAHDGEWLEFVTTAVKIGKSLDVAQGHVASDGRQCAFISATFSVLGGR